MVLHNPLKRIALAFFAWKFVLLGVAVLSPGPGYDTSSLIALNPSELRHTEIVSGSSIDRLSLNLFRWDALYFVKSAQRGYVYEQEWAFSWAYSLIIDTFVKLVSWNNSPPLHYYVCAGIVFSNACHLLSVFALYRLANIVTAHQGNGGLPYVASILYIVSPAGMFLSAPYAESLFALLNFTGMLLYGRAKTPDRRNQKPTIGQDSSVVGSAVLFVLATWVRTNGILSGLLYLFDAVICLLGMQRGENEIRRLIVTCVAGALLGIGAMLPQYVAYRSYCASDTGSSARPWCYKPVPSIYTWVQSHYWNVGFLRYWTLPNLPLFLIAAPMLWLFVQSSIAHLRHSTHHILKPSRTKSSSEAKNSKDLSSVPGSLPEFALPQLILAVTAATSFHVQVINRLSSGYPIWYLAVARWIIAQHSRRTQNKAIACKSPQWIFRGVVVYALIQGALFANFLPPA